ncbi:SDR family NAD(P)-dependent oxidoreductase [Sinimarinibacterium flocculans]|uniref:SDR family NAD(P)-dependent oxidoreductase n=1 Tax=Sinimarinibacterium flocculans TaxID=985250 RepID=UPI00249365F4|nr:SDR family oxidoreductase [Sinimarinibacterium flocculans]
MADSSQTPVAIITGGASGIGRATARALARAGFRTVVADINASGGELVCAQIVADGGQALAVATDVADPAQIERMVATTLSHWNRVDVLVNNAAALGLLAGDGEFLSTTVDNWDASYRANQRGAMVATQQVLPAMLCQGGGSIVNISSVDGELGDTTKIAYGMNKAAMNLFTQCIATAYGPRGVRCNAILPGLIMTEMAEANIGPEERPVWERNIRSPRLGTPEDVAAVVVFLAGSAAEYVNGQLIRVDGGLLSHVPHLAQFEALAESV